MRRSSSASVMASPHGNTSLRPLQNRFSRWTSVANDVVWSASRRKGRPRAWRSKAGAPRGAKARPLHPTGRGLSLPHATRAPPMKSRRDVSVRQQGLTSGVSSGCGGTPADAHARAHGLVQQLRARTTSPCGHGWPDNHIAAVEGSTMTKTLSFSSSSVCGGGLVLTNLPGIIRGCAPGATCESSPSGRAPAAKGQRAAVGEPTASGQRVVWSCAGQECRGEVR